MTSDLRTALNESLIAAEQLRDEEATSILRFTLASIDAAESGGQRFTPREVVDFVRRKVDDLTRAASIAYHPAGTQRLRNQAEILTVVLAKAGH